MQMLLFNSAHFFTATVRYLVTPVFSTLQLKSILN